MIEGDREMNLTAPRPHSIVLVAFATLACLVVAYFLWGITGFSALSMHDMFGDMALPPFTGLLIQHRILFWSLPILSAVIGGTLLVKGKHSTINLLLYASSLAFTILAVVTFTIVALLIPWLHLIRNVIGS